MDPEVRDGILGSLEKRWAKADQEVFILAGFFNPYIRTKCFNRASLTEAGLYRMAERVYLRIFGRAADLDFMKAFTDYVRKEHEFSSEAMSLEVMAEMHKKEVSVQTFPAAA